MSYEFYNTLIIIHLHGSKAAFIYIGILSKIKPPLRDILRTPQYFPEKIKQTT